MDGYNNQPTRTAFAGVTLTGAYSGNRKIIDCGGMTKISLDIDYAMGATESANILDFTLEHSPDGGSNWYSLVIDTTTTVSDVTPRAWNITGTNKVNVLVDIAYKQLRMSVLETGVVTNAGTATVVYTLSGI